MTAGKFVKRPSFLLCGDSLLQISTGPGGLATRLADVFSRKADVIVRGYSGYNTHRYLDLIRNHKAIGAWNFHGLVLLWLGANDAAKPAPSKPDQHVPLDQYAENLAAIVDLISADGSGLTFRALAIDWRDRSNSIILLTPPPVDDAAYDLHCQSQPKPTLRFLETTREYAKAVVHVGQRRKIPVVDVLNSMLACKNWKEFLTDGLHLTDAGYQKVFELVMGTIRASLPHWMPARLLLDAPIWQEAERWDDANPDFVQM